ncbi:MAG: hypothetical protein ACRDVM_05555, partial [Acidimicrobiia bacterium]
VVDRPGNPPGSPGGGGGRRADRMEDDSLMVQPSDIEAKAREIEQLLVETKESAQNTAVLAGGAVVAAVAAAFLFGRRKGRKGRAVVEVYRV